MVNWIIVAMLGLILSTLASGLYYLVKDQGKSKRTVTALTVRIVLSIVLFAALLLARMFGLITPHSLL